MIQHLVNVSSGKDSTATYLRAMELGRPFCAVFADTGHEHEWTYEFVDRLLGAANNGAMNMSEWKPIDTAPRDVWVLVWDEKSGVNVSHWTTGVDSSSDDPRQGGFTAERDTRDETRVLDGPVTHWMPLPAPPVST